MKRKILVSGLINLEITVKIDGFPIEYQPVRYPFFGVNSTVSGVGYNIAKALTVLGDQVDFLSIIGQDSAGDIVRQTLVKDRLSEKYIRSLVEKTAHSVILYDPSGKRAINVDLKNIQETAFPETLFDQAVKDSSLAVLCNINFSRPFLKKAKDLKIPIASDVHAIADLHDPYNSDFMKHADILFMSHEKLPCSPEEWVRELQQCYQTPVIVIGLGDQGALLAVRSEGFCGRIPAVCTRPIVNTIGAGDALFSAFIHFYGKGESPRECLKKAVVFASYKIGETGAAQGFLPEPDVLKLISSRA